MVCDCMVRYHHTDLTFARMERILTADPFYRDLGANSFERITQMPTFTRASLRVYVSRLRRQVVKALKKGGTLTGAVVLSSEPTDVNVVVHRLNLPVAISHRDA